MRPSPRLLNAASHRVHKPLIQFIGRRQWPNSTSLTLSEHLTRRVLNAWFTSAPEPQHPHPSAPAELQKSFQDFLSKFKSSGSTSSSGASQPSSSAGKQGENVQTFTDFWQAPEKLWKRQLSEAEIEAISVRLSMRVS